MDGLQVPPSPALHPNSRPLSAASPPARHFITDGTNGPRRPALHHINHGFLRRKSQAVMAVKRQA